jgi:hypothetical protein
MKELKKIKGDFSKENQVKLPFPFKFQAILIPLILPLRA